VKSATLRMRTKKHREILIVTSEVNEALSGLTEGDGICTLFTPHTTCGVTINENADPDVITDLEKAFEATIPDVKFRHGEGNSDAHFLSALIGASLPVPYAAGKLSLGRWQGIYFIEFDGPRERELRIYIE
jgi:secondary thiamine-phosphate synthase enzyme